MKILLIAPHPFYKERGTPIAVKLLIETLCESGHKVDLITFNEGEDITVDGLSIYRIPNLPFIKNVPIGFSVKKIIADVFVTIKMIGLLRKNKYDVIHAVEEAIFSAAFLNKFFHKKLVYDMDSSMADQLIEKWDRLNKFSGMLNGFEKWATKNSTAVIPVCKYLADKVELFSPETEVQILEDIAFDPDYSKNNNEDIRNFFPTGDVIAMYIGNLEHYQGIDLMLEGTAKVKSKVNFSIAIIGGNPESIMQYQNKSKNLFIDRKIDFLGTRDLDQLPFLLEQADILVSPRTKGKNTPMKVYSYLASGVPVLATDIDSHTQAMTDKDAKLFVPTPAGFAKAFEELLDSEDERKKIGEAGKKLAEENYSLRSYKKKLNHIYEWLEVA
ncbi:MAG: glycosyltransferase family 4 protein [Ignavibacteriae bacterium]|nr:glycosyltransferase family 4 protein [Ignavibacteriota bacterium]